MKLSGSAAGKPRPTRARPRVMVVDDDPDVREVLALRLNKAGFNAITANGGAQCLKLLPTARPAVILLDLMMPAMDGFEVCRALKADPATASIPVIVVTARDDSFARLHAARLGVSDFLVKPVSGERLIGRVKAQIELAEAMNQTQAAVERLQSGTQIRPEGRVTPAVASRAKGRPRG